MGYRKFAVTVAAMVLGTVAVGLGWIEGVQYVTIMTISAGAYIAGNVAAKAKAS